MGENDWGVGDQAMAKPFAVAMVGKTQVELITGQHPHSRSDNRHYARWPDGRIEEFDGHRIQIRVELQTYNYLKESELSGDQVRKGGTGRIFFNARQVYEWFFRDVQQACRQTDRLIGELLACPANLWESDVVAKLRGRRVFYRDTPAVISSVILDQGCVLLQAETPDGQFPSPPWRERDDILEADVKVEVIDPHIWWFRD